MKDFLNTRPLSWSAISAFQYDPEQWYRRYWLGIKDPPNKVMEFGKAFGKSIEDGKPMAPVTILSKCEQEFKIVFDGIPLVGFADTFDHKTKKRLGEYKTSARSWSQSRVDDHGQITMYALMNYITNKVKPEECEFFLENVLTEEQGDFSIVLKQPVKVYHFKTKRTMADILRFAQLIKDTVKAMGEYVKSYPHPTLDKSSKVR